MADEIFTYRGRKFEAIDENDPLLPGDRVLIRFKWLIDGFWFRAYQLGKIDQVLTRRKDWRVVSYVNETDSDSLLAEIVIVEPPAAQIQQATLAVTTTIIITTAIIATAWTVYNLSKVYQWKLIAAGKLPTEAATRVEEIGAVAHVAAYVAAVIGVLFVLKRLFGSSGSDRSSGGYGYG